MSDTAIKPSPTSNLVPPHVPPESVVHFDFRNDAGYHLDPHARIDELRKEHRAFYTPISRGLAGVGTWVFTHADDIRAIMQDPETFQSGGLRPFGKAIGDSWILIPIDLDPPDHGKFRTWLNPIFSPKVINGLSDRVRNRAIELVEGLRGRTSCEMIEAFARPFPVSIFLELLGLPLSEIDRLVEIEEAILHAPPDAQLRGIRDLRDYLAEQIALRRQAPGDDLLSFAVKGQIDGRPTTEDEVMGVCFMMFLGGLDTVTSTLGYMFRYLGEHPLQQEKLRQDPSLIPSAVEELIRAYGVVTTGRFATKDVTIGGIFVKKGDNVSMPMTAANRDPAEFPDPTDLDFERSPNRHSGFGYGPHRCIGSHLARREAIVAIEEWLARLPPFRVAEGAQMESSGTGVVCLNQVPLIWD
jgi:cytochrome P450